MLVIVTILKIFFTCYIKIVPFIIIISPFLLCVAKKKTGNINETYIEGSNSSKKRIETKEKSSAIAMMKKSHKIIEKEEKIMTSIVLDIIKVAASKGEFSVGLGKYGPNRGKFIFVLTHKTIFEDMGYNVYINETKDYIEIDWKAYRKQHNKENINGNKI